MRPYRILMHRLKMTPLRTLANRLLLSIGVALLLLSGCSSMRLAYNTADFFIGRYADDYLGLDGSQMERWSPTLDAALARHREQELPYLAAFFNSAQNEARKGFTEAGVGCLLDQFEVIYRRHFTLAAETAAHPAGRSRSTPDRRAGAELSQRGARGRHGQLPHQRRQATA
jgi:hypothetical protein